MKFDNAARYGCMTLTVTFLLPISENNLYIPLCTPPTVWQDTDGCSFVPDTVLFPFPVYSLPANCVTTWLSKYWKKPSHKLSTRGNSTDGLIIIIIKDSILLALCSLLQAPGKNHSAWIRNENEYIEQCILFWICFCCFACIIAMVPNWGNLVGAD